MIIENTGPSITLADIADFEAELAIRLPATYQDFLLACNGGAPAIDVGIDVPGIPGSPTDVQVFFGLGRAVVSSDLRWNVKLLENSRSPDRLLPIACDSGGNLFCLRFERGRAVEVAYYELFKETLPIPVARTFEGFVQSLES